MRVFVAAELPKNFIDSISELLKEWQERDKDLRWVYKENIHITLAFLGELDELGVQLLEKALEYALFNIKKINFSARWLVYLPYENYNYQERYGPDYRRNKINGFAFSINEGEKELMELAGTIEYYLQKIGKENNYAFRPKEKREFFPHITIARKGRNQIDQNYFNNINDKLFECEIKGTADTVTIFQSELFDKSQDNRRYESPKYTPIKTFHLI
jgi:2'-5' RNA ligase